MYEFGAPVQKVDLYFQDALRTSLEASMIPAFEMSCKNMFEQVDATLQGGLIKHTTAAQQQFESTHSPLAVTLRVCMTCDILVGLECIFILGLF